MAKNTGRNSRVAVTADSNAARSESMGTRGRSNMWVRRDGATGQFRKAKAEGGAFKSTQAEK